jgi:hypothetical protein
METTMLSPADAMLLGQRDGFGDGNSWVWIFLLFALFGGNGFGWGNRGEAAEGIATRAAVNDGFQYSQLDNGIRSIQNGMCDGFYAVNNSLKDGFYTTTGAIKDCCCTTQRTIDGVKYDMAKGFGDVITANNLNTRDILESQNASTQKILDYMCANEKQALRDRIQTLETSSIVQAQTRNLVETLKPSPVPAYITASPYVNYGGYGYGCGCGI